MEIKYLQEFLVLARTLNYSDAAEEVNIDKSGLSRHIQTLEKELGTQLFDRSKRNIQLSTFGKMYITFAESICDEYQRSEKFLKTYLTQSNNSFKVGVPRNYQYYGITKSLTDFNKVYPKYRVDIIEATDPELLQMYRSEALDLIAVYHKENTTHDYEFVCFKKGYMVVVLPKTHKLSSCKYLTCSLLKDENILLGSRNSRMYAMVMDEFSKANIKPHVVYEGYASSVFQFISAGMGLSIMPIQMAQINHDENLMILPLKPEIKYEYGLGYRKGASYTPSEKAFIKYYKELSKHNEK